MMIGQTGLVGNSGERSAMLRDGALERPVDLTREIELPQEVRGGLLPGPTSTIRKVLLTGATGFLGEHLLREFLERTSAEIRCLVRCNDPAAGYQRIELGSRLN